jgi:hypothetical protein
MELDRSNKTPGEPGAGERRPYRRPRILSREPLEVMASVCAPGPPPAGPAKNNPILCPQGPISS